MHTLLGISSVYIRQRMLNLTCCKNSLMRIIQIGPKFAPGFWQPNITFIGMVMKSTPNLPLIAVVCRVLVRRVSALASVMGMTSQDHSSMTKVVSLGLDDKRFIEMDELSLHSDTACGGRVLVVPAPHPASDLSPQTTSHVTGWVVIPDTPLVTCVLSPPPPPQCQRNSPGVAPWTRCHSHQDPQVLSPITDADCVADSYRSLLHSFRPTKSWPVFFFLRAAGGVVLLGCVPPPPPHHPSCSAPEAGELVRAIHERKSVRGGGSEREVSARLRSEGECRSTHVTRVEGDVSRCHARSTRPHAGLRPARAAPRRLHPALPARAFTNLTASSIAESRSERAAGGKVCAPVECDSEVPDDAGNSRR
ncbi:hypothetical protein PR048_021027 [Dryococelus australis]|uniref:Uncharacterized protein n=1 Tax=Dryococelus australis TaxID=614101 RepID=A0ABQ9GX36_9NEOP|nr:hypothetical protein PR048_021027 [Dryococelus australis]